jgi:hypothetical protein
MSRISANAIDYLISSNDVATVQSSDDCVSVLLPRNSIAFAGNVVRVAVLCPISVLDSLKSILIPHSIGHISGNVFSSKSRSASLVFEHGSELKWIGWSAFRSCALQCVFIPQSVDFIGSRAFVDCKSITHVYFGCHSSIWQLKSQNFSELSSLSAITIPASIRQIHGSAFSRCSSLSCVTFESHSQCWYISLAAFSGCGQLRSFFLPPHWKLSIRVVGLCPPLFLVILLLIVLSFV